MRTPTCRCQQGANGGWAPARYRPRCLVTGDTSRIIQRQQRWPPSPTPGLRTLKNSEKFFKSVVLGILDSLSSNNPSPPPHQSAGTNFGLAHFFILPSRMLNNYLPSTVYLFLFKEPYVCGGTESRDVNWCFKLEIFSLIEKLKLFGFFLLLHGTMKLHH